MFSASSHLTGLQTDAKRTNRALPVVGGGVSPPSGGGVGYAAAKTTAVENATIAVVVVTPVICGIKRDFERTKFSQVLFTKFGSKRPSKSRVNMH